MIPSRTRESAPARRGAALAGALAAMTIVALLVSASMFAATYELRAARGALHIRRLRAIAESALAAEMQEWPRSRNRAGPFAPGSLLSRRVAMAASDSGVGADSAIVRIARSSLNTFWLSASAGQSGSEQRVSRLIHLSLAGGVPDAAITTDGVLTLGAPSSATGVEAQDPNLVAWPECRLAVDDRPAVAGARVTPTAAVIEGGGSLAGEPRLVRDSIGGAARALLSALNAAVREPDAVPSVLGALTPGPVYRNNECVVGDPRSELNWGEPLRGANAVEACANRTVVVVARGPLVLLGGRGQGVLLSEGDIELGGDFAWYGIIATRGRITGGAGGARVHGALIAQGSVDLTGVAATWSRCAVETAARAMAVPRAIAARGWMPGY